MCARVCACGQLVCVYVCVHACECACVRVCIVCVLLIIKHIKYVHSIVSYQWAIYQKYDQRGHASPNGYWLLPISVGQLPQFLKIN